MSNVPIDDQIFRLIPEAPRWSQFLARAAQGRGPSLDTLPVEILLNIFENGSYSDLKKRFPLVCRRFRDILRKKTSNSRSVIARTLWRDHPRRPRPFGKDDCEINPLLLPGRLDWRYTQHIEPILRSNCWGGFVRLVDIPLKYENASSPAVSRAAFHVSFGSHEEQQSPLIIRGTGDGGRVTVMDVLNEIVDAVKVKVTAEWPSRAAGRRWTGIDKAYIINGILQLFAEI